ncbi:MAG: alpha/beta fold hydrolase [bacterium]|nr:alpha/beta fold hydrolase [bacterium]
MDPTSQTITLSDGRILSFAEWGDMNGKPVFYFTSAEASRYSRHPDETILTSLGVHLYTFDRPGKGLSTPHKNSGLLDWAKDIREFVSQKNITRFAMIGHSQGAIHCLACAYVFPELVSSVTAITNITGLDDEEIKANMSRYFRVQLFMGRHAPWLMTLQWNVLRLSLKGKRGEKILLNNMRSLPERDKTTFNIAGSHDVMFQSMREGLRQGGKSITHDFCIVIGDWGFKLEDIQSKIFIWHGESDPMIPASMSRYMAKHIPNNETTIIPEEGALLIYSQWRKILEQLLAYWKE